MVHAGRWGIAQLAPRRFVPAIAQSPQFKSLGAAMASDAVLRMGEVALVQRFSSWLSLGDQALHGVQ